MRWPNISNWKMPDIGNVELPEMGNSGSSILVTLGIILIGFLIFRKLIKIAVLVGFIFMIMYMFSG